MKNPPKLEDVILYAKVKKLNIDAEDWYRKQVFRNWTKDNGRPMERWRVAITMASKAKAPNLPPFITVEDETVVNFHEIIAATNERIDSLYNATKSRLAQQNKTLFDALKEIQNNSFTKKEIEQYMFDTLKANTHNWSLAYKEDMKYYIRNSYLNAEKTIKVHTTEINELNRAYSALTKTIDKLRSELKSLHDDSFALKKSNAQMETFATKIHNRVNSLEAYHNRPRLHKRFISAIKRKWNNLLTFLKV